MPIPVDAGFHQICYDRFTNKQRIERVTNNMKKREGNLGLEVVSKK